MRVPSDLGGLLRCVWKKMVLDKTSSTFEEVRIKPSHPLRPCLGCSGFDACCFGYRSLQEKFFERYYEKNFPSDRGVKYA